MSEQEIMPRGAPMGRPSMRTPAIVDELCERLSNGEPLTKICRDDHMPSFSTVWRWERDDPEFSQLSARARENGTHYLAHECVEIADEAGLTPERIAKARVQIDTRIRLIGKWNRIDYGDKLEVRSRNLNANTEMPTDPIEAARAYEQIIKGGQ